MSRLFPIGVRDLAAHCRDRAQLDGADNMTAIVLLLAAKALERQADRLTRQAVILERLEAQHDAQ